MKIILVNMSIKTYLVYYILTMLNNYNILFLTMKFADWVWTTYITEDFLNSYSLENNLKFHKLMKLWF